MKKFNAYNTDGYSEYELEILNGRYENALARTEEDASDPDVQQVTAEKIQCEFDSGLIR